MSIIKHKNQRVAVLIDVQNLYHSAKNLFKARVNFHELVKTAIAGRALIRALAYVVATETGEEKAFFDALKRAGIEIKVKDLQVFAGGLKKGDWDVGMAMDALSLSSNVDAIVLATGDGDFVPLVNFLKFNRGVQVEVVAFDRSASAKLKEAADDFMDLGESKKFLLKGN